MRELRVSGRVRDAVIDAGGYDSVSFAGGAKLRGCRLVNFTFAKLVGFEGLLRRIEFSDCVFDGCRMEDLVTGRVLFDSCRFDGGEWRRWFAFEVSFVNCVFATRLTEVVFHGRDVTKPSVWPIRNRVEGNDFTAATLRGCGFRGGVALSRQRFADTGEVIVSHSAADAIAVLEQLSQHEPGEVRREVDIEVRMLRDDMQDGQVELFEDIGTVDQNRPEQVRAWELIRQAADRVA